MPVIKANALYEPTEAEIHKAVIRWVNLHKDISYYIFHIPNEGKRTKAYGKYLQDLGMRRGVADLFIALPRHSYHGAWIEIKRKGGKLSVYQEFFLKAMESQGYYTAVCYSVDEAILVIGQYCGI